MGSRLWLCENCGQTSSESLCECCMAHGLVDTVMVPVSDEEKDLLAEMNTEERRLLGCIKDHAYSAEVPLRGEMTAEPETVRQVDRKLGRQQRTRVGPSRPDAWHHASRR